MMIGNPFVRAYLVVISRLVTWFLVTPIVFLMFLPVAILIVMLADNVIDSTALGVIVAIFILICARAERAERKKKRAHGNDRRRHRASAVPTV